MFVFGFTYHYDYHYYYVVFIHLTLSHVFVDSPILDPMRPSSFFIQLFLDPQTL